MLEQSMCYMGIHRWRVTDSRARRLGLEFKLETRQWSPRTSNTVEWIPV